MLPAPQGDSETKMPHVSVVTQAFGNLPLSPRLAPLAAGQSGSPRAGAPLQ